MSYAKVLCVGLVGVTGHLVEVEADLSPGLPALALSGLPDTALHEARDRVRAAIVNSGQHWPNRRITVNNSKQPPAVNVWRACTATTSPTRRPGPRLGTGRALRCRGAAGDRARRHQCHR